MPVEVKLKGRIADVEIISQDGSNIEIRVDKKNYKVDLMHNAQGTFSIIEGGHSYDIELTRGDLPKKYTAYTLYNTYDIEIIDAETRYQLNRGGENLGRNENSISSPMPGKVTRILVSEGDIIKAGDTALIISAMKMESEYKSPKNGLVKTIFVKEGDTIEANQILIGIE